MKRTRRLNWWVRWVLTEYEAARAQWEADAENASYGYATELAEYAREHPRPLFRDFLIGLAFRPTVK